MNFSINKVALAITSLCAALTVNAQTDTHLSQYYEVPAFYNPAAIGNTDNIRIHAGSRMQWVGIENAPRTFLAMADMPVKLGKKRLAVGLVTNSESQGLFSNLSIGVQAGYKLNILKGQLTGGIQLGYANEVFRGSEVFIPDGDEYHEPTDEAIPRTDVSGGAFDIGLGAFFVHKYFWTGISATHITSPTISFSDDQASGSSTGGSSTDLVSNRYEIQLRRTLYFMGGSNIPIKNTLFEVLPSVMVKSDFTFTSAEITGRVRYKKLFTFGLGYRLDDAVIATLAAEYNGFFVGYSFDYPTSAISKASSGSHEIIAGYSLKLNLSDKNKNKHKSIRIM